MCGGGGPELLAQFLIMCLAITESRKEFEAIESYLALFLKIHADEIAENSDLIELVEKVSSIHENAWKDLNGTLNSCATLVSFYKNNFVY